jgi:hypothetical protein
MSWEQDITQLLQEAQEMAVRFDIEQNLTQQQEETARTNIGYVITTTLIEKNKYKVNLV